jgi:hypothetical protein
VLGSSSDVAQTGFTLLLGRDVNWKSIGASVERSALNLEPISGASQQDCPSFDVFPQDQPTVGNQLLGKIKQQDEFS